MKKIIITIALFIGFQNANAQILVIENNSSFGAHLELENCVGSTSGFVVPPKTTMTFIYDGSNTSTICHLDDGATGVTYPLISTIGNQQACNAGLYGSTSTFLGTPHSATWSDDAFGNIHIEVN